MAPHTLSKRWATLSSLWVLLIDSCSYIKYDSRPTFLLLRTNLGANCAYEKVGECMVGNEGDIRNRMITTPGDIYWPYIVACQTWWVTHTFSPQLRTQVSVLFPLTGEESNAGGSPLSLGAVATTPWPSSQGNANMTTKRRLKFQLCQEHTFSCPPLGSSLETCGKSFGNVPG